MNEIQKFKLEKKILKASGGTNIKFTRAKEEAISTYNRKIHNGKWTWGLYDNNGNFIPITKQVIFKDGTILNTNGSKSSISARNAVKNAKVIERGYIDANGNKIPINPKLNYNKVKPKRPLKDWGKEFTNFMGGLSSELQEWLKLNGLQDATRLQEYLNTMKFDVGKFGADGKFGKDSKAAWDRFVASGIMGKNNDQEILKKKLEELPLLDAPDPFGYSTTNHYGDGIALKGLGFNNYNGLKNYVIANPNDQFAKDLKQRFGEDTSAWDQAAVEGGLGVSGTYRGGYVGDFGDMARSMMNWAAETNATHDKKELASRTDSDGNVYGNSNVAKLFDKYSISSKIADIKKLKFPDLDFNLKQGNIGISTLGNQPGMFRNQSGMFDAANYEGVV